VKVAKQTYLLERKIGGKMTGKIIDGNAIAERIKKEIRDEIEKLKKKHNGSPCLTAVCIGENPATKVYVKNQKQTCEEVGIEYGMEQLDGKIKEEELLGKINELNKSDRITGIIIQMPVPNHINARKIQMSVAPDKDVEVMTPPNLGNLVYAGINPVVAPCTALSVVECLKSTGVELKGKETVIVGHSEIVGKPVTLMLLSSLLESVTPTVCHIATRDLTSYTKRAEILIVAVGKAGLIKGDMVKDGAIVIDVGINRVNVKDEKGNDVIDEKTGKQKKKTVGDVVFEDAVKRASFITPVPGGVGAVTTVLLLKNVLHLWKMRLGEPDITYKIL